MRPVMPVEAENSEAAYEDYVSDRFDWGDERNLVAYRWCEAWNKIAEVKTDCGEKPEGVE